MPLSLSGYLPGSDDDGLSVLAERLISEFETVYGTEDEAEIDVLVVGRLRVAAVKHRRNPKDNPPIVEVRFVSIETCAGPEADQVAAIVTRLKEARIGVTPLPFDDSVADEDLPDPDNVAEPERPKRPKGGLRAVDPPDFSEPDADGFS